MAELLVSNRRRNNRRGEVVVVMPDGHRWGKKEREPDFTVIKQKGVDPRKFADLLEPNIVRIGGQDVQIARRKKRITDVDTAKTATRESSLRNWVGAY